MVVILIVLQYVHSMLCTAITVIVLLVHVPLKFMYCIHAVYQILKLYCVNDK